MWWYEDGATVKEGDRVADTQTMKVAFPVLATASGILHHLVEVGELVDISDPVGEIEEE